MNEEILMVVILENSFILFIHIVAHAKSKIFISSRSPRSNGVHELQNEKQKTNHIDAICIAIW